MASKRSRHDDVQGLLQRCIDGAGGNASYASNAMRTIGINRHIEIRDAAVLCHRIPGMLAALKDEHVQINGAIPVRNAIEQVLSEIPGGLISEDVLLFCLSRCICDSTDYSQVEFIRATSSLFAEVRPAPYGALTRRLLHLADLTGPHAAAYVLLYMTADRPGVQHDAGLVQRLLFHPRNVILSLHDRGIHGTMNRDLLDAFVLDTTLERYERVVGLMERNGRSLSEMLDYCAARLALPAVYIQRLVRIIIDLQDPLQLLSFMNTRFDVFAPVDVRAALLKHTAGRNGYGVLVQRTCARLEIAHHIAQVPREMLAEMGLDASSTTCYYGEHAARPSVRLRAGSAKHPARSI
jgi:hypothetical protein